MLHILAVNEDNLDQGRLERGMRLDVIPVEPGCFRVIGGQEEHYVDLHAGAGSHCDCGDHTWKGSVCKHIVAASLYERRTSMILKRPATPTAKPAPAAARPTASPPPRPAAKPAAPKVDPRVAEAEAKLEALRQLSERLKNPGKGGGGGQFDDILWPFEEGQNKSRLLPLFDPNTGEPDPVNFFVEVWVHFGQGPESKNVRCTKRMTEVKDASGKVIQAGWCEICDAFEAERIKMNAEFKRQEKATTDKTKKEAIKKKAKEAWYALRDKYGIGPDGTGTVQYLGVVVPYSKKDPNKILPEFKIAIWRTKVMGQLLDHRFHNPACGDFVDLELGRPMTIFRKGTTKDDTEYTVFPGDRCKLHSKLCEMIAEGRLPDIYGLIEQWYPTLNSNQQQALLNGIDWETIQSMEPDDPVPEAAPQTTDEAEPEPLADEEQPTDDEPEGLADEGEIEEEPPPPPARPATVLRKPAVAKPAAAPQSKSGQSVRDRLLAAARK